MMTDPNEDMLDALFAEAQTVSPRVSDDLMARVLADAAAAHAVEPAIVVSGPGLWARVLEMVGGWPAISGLAVATVAGIWVGVAPPAGVSDFAASLMGDSVAVDVFTDTEFLTAGFLADG